MSGISPPSTWIFILKCNFILLCCTWWPTMCLGWTPRESEKNTYSRLPISQWRNRPVPLPEVPLAEVLLLEVPLFDVPLADVPQPLDPDPIDPEVAEPVPEQESSWKIISSMSLDEELMSLLLPSTREPACKNREHRGESELKTERQTQGIRLEFVPISSASVRIPSKN